MSGASGLISLSGTPASAARLAVARCSGVIGKFGSAAAALPAAPAIATPSERATAARAGARIGAERVRRLMKAGLVARGRVLAGSRLLGRPFAPTAQSGVVSAALAAATAVRRKSSLCLADSAHKALISQRNWPAQTPRRETFHTALR